MVTAAASKLEAFWRLKHARCGRGGEELTAQHVCERVELGSVHLLEVRNEYVSSCSRTLNG